MQNAETLVYKVLIKDMVLINLLGGKKKVGTCEWNRIYNSAFAPNSDEYPRITMFEVRNGDAEPADDKPQFSDVNIRIDLWTKDETKIFDISKQIKKLLENSFLCKVTPLEKSTEPDTLVHHKSLELKMLLEQESDT